MAFLRKAIPLALGLAALAAPAGASATVSNAQFGFCDPSCLDTTTTGKAGANVSYHFQWTVPGGFDGGDPSVGGGPSGDNSQSFTIDGSGGKAPGTVFPTDPDVYQIGYLTGGYSVNPFRSGAIQVTNGGEDFVVTPFNGSLNVPPGAMMELDIHFNSPENGCAAGGGKLFSISTSADAAANTNTFSLVPGDPNVLTRTDGDNQSSTVGNAFGEPLKVHLGDICGNNISGTNVSFTTPGTGASGSFAAGTSTTDANGVATSTALTANTIAGGWEATASVTGGTNPTTTFDLGNDADVPSTAELGVVPESIPADGFSTANATLHLEDQYGNPTPGLDTNLFSFTSTDTGHDFGVPSDAGGGDYTSEITASNTPGTSTITGTYDDGLINKQDTALLEQSADLVAPDATINIGPGKKGKDRTPTFFFSADEDNASFECKLDSGGYKDCDSPHTTSKLSFGKHKVSVRAYDGSGNVGDADSLSFKIVK